MKTNKTKKTSEKPAPYRIKLEVWQFLTGCQGQVDCTAVTTLPVTEVEQWEPGSGCDTQLTLRQRLTVAYGDCVYFVQSRDNSGELPRIMLRDTAFNPLKEAPRTSLTVQERRVRTQEAVEWAVRRAKELSDDSEEQPDRRRDLADAGTYVQVWRYFEDPVCKACGVRIRACLCRVFQWE